MSVKYNVVARKNPRDPDAPPKYYPSIVSSGREGMREIAKQIAEISTVSSVDTMASLESLLSVLPRILANGNIVDLGDFGTFWLRVKTEGSESEADVTARNITNVQIQFRPGKEFKRALEVIEFKKA